MYGQFGVSETRTVPVCIEATVTHNGGVVALLAYVTHNGRSVSGQKYYMQLRVPIFGPKLEAKLLEIYDVTL